MSEYPNKIQEEFEKRYASGEFRSHIDFFAGAMAAVMQLGQDPSDVLGAHTIMCLMGGRHPYTGDPIFTLKVTYYVRGDPQVGEFQNQHELDAFVRGLVVGEIRHDNL